MSRRNLLFCRAMAAHPLDGVRLKLFRAQKHLHDVIEVVGRMENGQCEIIPEHKPDSNLGVLRIRLTPKPPPELSVVAGDCLFNLRSALDHLVWQLVLANGKMPTRHNMFPICESPKAFAYNIGKLRRLDGVSAQAHALIESLQPYPTRENPLGMLATLHNIDKHQTINVTTAVARDTELVWGGGPAELLSETGDPAAVLETFLGDEELRDGAIMPIGLNLVNDRVRDRFSKMKVQGYAAMFVAFHDPGATELEPLRVDSVLQQICDFVGNTVISGFERFFD